MDVNRKMGLDIPAPLTWINCTHQKTTLIHLSFYKKIIKVNRK